MKKLFSFIISLCLFVIIVLAVFVYIFTDNTMEMDVNKIDTTSSVESILSNEVGSSFSTMKDTYSVDINFSEEDINNLLYCFVKTKLNPDYDPKNGTNDETKYVKGISIPSDFPVIGGKKAVIKYLYAQVNGQDVTINMPFKCFGINMRFYFTFNISETPDDYILNISKAYFSKISLTTSVFKKALNSMEKDINQSFENSGLPFVLNVNDMNLVANKDTFTNWIKSLVTESEEEDTMLKSFMDVMFSKQYELLKFGVFDEKLGLKIDLNKLKVEDKKLILNEDIKKGFNQETFIKEKTQNLLMNSLVGNSEINFTEMEFSQLIYDKTNQYNDFTLTYEILNNVMVNFSIEGITVDINDTGEEMTLYFILNINGLKTLVSFKGVVNQVSDTKIIINMANDIILGNDINIDSSFIKPMLQESLKDSTVLKYDLEQNAFIINSNIFEEFLSSTLLSSKLEVTKIRMDKDKLVLYVESHDIIINSILNSAKTELNECLSKDFVDASKFDITDEKQKEAIENLETSLSNVKEKINNDSLAQDDIEQVVTSINGLNEENKQELFNQLQESSSSDVFTNLYDQLFKK